MNRAPRNVVCMVVDRLRASALGAYGGAWGETPDIDRLAAESLLFDFALVDRPTLAGFYQAVWRGRHAMQGDRPEDAAGSPRPSRRAKPRALPDLLALHGVRGVLVADEAEIAQAPLADGFSECVLATDQDSGADRSDQDEALAASLEETRQARLTAAAIDQLERLAKDREPFCLWIHSRGLGGPWDAPLAFRNRLVDPGDPLPPQGTGVPRRLLGDDFDPDEVFKASCCYQGQVSLLDACLGLLIEQLEGAGLAESTLFVLVGARGFPLGEHARLGPVDESLYGETVHIPLMLRFPDGEVSSTRSPALVQPADLFATLCNWLGLPGVDRSPWSLDLASLQSDPFAAPRDRVCLVHDNEWAIRTPGWFLRTPAAGLPELYVKPDDRFEANDVSKRCEAIVEDLTAARDEFSRLVRGELDALTPLSEELLVAQG